MTGEPLVQRDDDRDQTVRRRLSIYHSQTEPLVEFYSQWQTSGDSRAPAYFVLDGLGTVEEIRANLLAGLEK